MAVANVHVTLREKKKKNLIYFIVIKLLKTKNSFKKLLHIILKIC